jgi:outer membrane protein assembly factor BamD (BamD/ComL family)
MKTLLRIIALILFLFSVYGIISENMLDIPPEIHYLLCAMGFALATSIAYELELKKERAKKDKFFDMYFDTFLRINKAKRLTKEAHDHIAELQKLIDFYEGYTDNNEKQITKLSNQITGLKLTIARYKKKKNVCFRKN